MLKKINILKAVAFIIVLINIPYCLKKIASQESKNQEALSKAQQNLVKADNEFGLKLFKEVVKEEGNKNVLVSPLSVSMALGMAYNGAAGSTKTAMEKTLELSGLTVEEINESYKNLIDLLKNLDPGVELQLANSIWYRQGFSVEDNFVNLNKTYFDAKISALDFNSSNAVDIINAWVRENTNNKIEKIVDCPIDPNTEMFLINALYFKGIWAQAFDMNKTFDGFFQVSADSKKACRMMRRKDKFAYFETADFQEIELPYGSGRYSMVIFLPKPQMHIDSLVAKFSKDNWDAWIDSLSEKEVSLYMPSFKLEYEIELNKTLKVLGMEIAFSSGQANFSNINKTDKLFISNVKHKTFMEVNEEGTEAAAVTAVVIRFASVPSGIVMRVDRPFVFAIRESDSETILFAGKVVNPD